MSLPDKIPQTIDHTRKIMTPCIVSGIPCGGISQRQYAHYITDHPETGGPMILATSIAIVTAIFPPGERRRALGLNVAAVYSGLL
jgi:hypothetical protein